MMIRARKRKRGPTPDPAGDPVLLSGCPKIDYSRSASERSIDMLLNKYYHREYQTEINMPDIPDISAAALKKPLREASILFLTDGGLVPKGNPDHVAPFCGSDFYVYEIGTAGALEAADYQISHQGYDHTAVLENPNRLVPVDAAHRLAETGVIREVYPAFISVAGVMTPTSQSIQLGKKIAQYIDSCPADAVVITSTCGTSTRCGTYIALEIKKLGIPVIQIANLVNIAESYGMRKVVKGMSVDCPLGNPLLPEKEEADMRLRMLEEALSLLETD